MAAYGLASGPDAAHTHARIVSACPPKHLSVACRVHEHGVDAFCLNAHGHRTRQAHESRTMPRPGSGVRSCKYASQEQYSCPPTSPARCKQCQDSCALPDHRTHAAELHDDDRVGVDGLIRRGRPTEHAPGCRSSLPSSFLIRPIALRCSWVRAHDGRKAGARARRQSGKQGRP
jgi:hypothetical protein